MALKLRKAIIGNALVHAGTAMAIGASLSIWTGLPAIAGLLFLPMGAGAFGAWRSMEKIKDSYIAAVDKPFAYARIERRRSTAAQGFDWVTIDDYAAQLIERGFTALGDFTLHPIPQSPSAVASVFVDATKTITVEIQHVKSLGVHFALTSLVGGNIRVMTSDHVPTSFLHLIRGDSDVSAFYPGTGLLGLLELHSKVIAKMQSRTDKVVSSGLNMPRHLLLVRERLRRAHARLANMNGYSIAAQVDEFESSPLRRWAPATDKLMAQPWRSLEALDATLDSRDPALVLDIRGPQTVI
jgi:hypothetical protein